MHLLCASTSRSIPATSFEGFSCYRYAVRIRGSCLCSDRFLIKWAMLAIPLLLVLKELCTSETETVSQHYCTPH